MADWSNGEPDSATSASITNGTTGTPTDVQLNGGGANVLNLTLASNNTLDLNLNSTLTVNGTSIANGGTINLTAGSANNSYLVLENNVTLSGAGVLNLSYGDHNGNAFVEESGGPYTLTNAGSTIQGDGIIGNSGLTLVNGTGGTVNANVSSQSLTLNGTGGITNQGVLEATGGGILQISSDVANAGGNITANSGTVNVDDAVTGGMLNTAGTGVLETSGSAALNSVTITSGSTYTAPLNTTTALTGTLTNDGSLQLNAGSATNTYLEIEANTTLQGGGTVTLNSGDTNGLVYIQENGSNLTLTNADNLIQGYGDIGDGGLTLVNAAPGVINADVSGRTLTLDGTGGITNAGLLEATLGGALQISTPVNDSGGSVTADAGTVIVSTTVQGGTLTTAGGGTLETGGTATLDGLSQGPITLPSGSTYTGPLNTVTNVQGTIVIGGNIQLNAGSATNTELTLVGDTTLQGAGTVTLNSGDNNGKVYIQESEGGFTLTNQVTIQGYGVIGNSALTLVNAPGATIDANVSGQTLTINPSGGFTNSGGTLEASGGGILALSGSSLENAGGTIEVNGSTSVVQFVNGATIEGGTLTTVNGGTLGVPNTSITLDGSTEGALTISGGSIYNGALNTDTSVLGTINNVGAMELFAGSATNTEVTLVADTTLQGAGAVTLNSGDNNGQVYIEAATAGLTLTNVDNLIQGYGVIGNSSLAFVNEAAGTVDANIATDTLLLNGSGNIINLGLMEATNGGILQITNVVENAGANITADGGTVLIDAGASIRGGTLNSLGGGTLGLGTGTAVIDGSANAITLSAGSTWTAGLGSQTTLLGTIVNQGNFQLNAGSATNTVLNIGTNTTLQGGGTITLNSGDNNGQVYVESDNASVLTDQDNTIQGYGVIGNGGMALDVASAASIDANAAGDVLVLNGGGGVANSGTLEATNGGALHVATVVANSGIVSANGGTVDIVGGTVEGGTLSGAALETTSNATLDGSTNGALTLAPASTYNGLLDTTTTLLGVIINQGAIQINAGSANNTNLNIAADTTLQGGGTLVLNSGDNNGQAYLQESAGGITLTNVDNVVEGYGVIGNSGLSLLNAASGIIQATGPGETLTINASGTVTNNGTFGADDAVLSLTYDPSNLPDSTLTGGTWEATNGGTLSFSSTANAIVTNDATLVLDGAGSGIQTRTGLGGTYQQLEQTLVTNDGTLEATGNRNFGAANSLINNGVIQLGGGTLTAPSLTNGPVSSLTGYGTFAPTGGVAIANGAMVSPGSAVTGQQIATLTFGTPLILGGGGVFAFDLMNAPTAVAGTDYDTLVVTGALAVTATPATPFSVALTSINPATGNPGLANFNAAQAYSWTLVSAGSISGFSPADFSFSTSMFQNSLNGGTFLVGESGNTLTLDFVPVPEPSAWALILGGVGVIALSLYRRQSRGGKKAGSFSG